MDNYDKDLRAKARRRIKRFIETGEPQARVHDVKFADKQVFEYKIKHHVQSIFFKRDILGRLREVK